MSISKFRQNLQLQETELSQNEKTWFPKWLMAYCSFHKLEASADSIPISVELAIPFSQSLKATGTQTVALSGIKFFFRSCRN